jgi:uncharacterized protein (TIGR02147 family)
MQPLFEYAATAQILRDALERHPERNGRRLTLAQLTKRLGYRSPRTVAMVLKGQRAPSEDLMRRLGRELGVNRKEVRYLELLGQFERRQRKGKALEDELLLEWHALKQHQKPVASYTIEAFEPIAEWYYLVLKQLTGTQGFVEDPEQIRERLRRKVTQAEIRQALARLEHFGHLVRDATGALQVASPQTESHPKQPSSFVRNHHRQMMARATEALAEQPMEERQFMATTLTIPQERFQEAAEDVRRFHQEFREKYAPDAAADVYQLNVQLFKHTGTKTKASHRLERERGNEDAKLVKGNHFGAGPHCAGWFCRWR